MKVERNIPHNQSYNAMKEVAYSKYEVFLLNRCPITAEERHHRKMGWLDGYAEATRERKLRYKMVADKYGI